MNLTTAEEWMFKAGCREPNRKIGGIKVVTGLNIDDIRQIQADALRAAAELCQKELDENGCEGGMKSAIQWCKSSIAYEANQLHPLPESNITKVTESDIHGTRP